MLLAFALILSVPPAEEPPIPPVPEARADLVEAFRALFASSNSDHDDRLSRTEWNEAFADTGGSNSQGSRASPIRMVIAAPPEQVFRDLDSSDDGQISFEEFVREPLATFDCMDADHDGIVQPAEDEAGEARCSAIQTPVRAPAP